jgi:hypothetical protein
MGLTHRRARSTKNRRGLLGATLVLLALQLLRADRPPIERAHDQSKLLIHSNNVMVSRPANRTFVLGLVTAFVASTTGVVLTVLSTSIPLPLVSLIVEFDAPPPTEAVFTRVISADGDLGGGKMVTTRYEHETGRRSSQVAAWATFELEMYGPRERVEVPPGLLDELANDEWAILELEGRKPRQQFWVEVEYEVTEPSPVPMLAAEPYRVSPIVLVIATVDTDVVTSSVASAWPVDELFEAMDHQEDGEVAHSQVTLLEGVERGWTIADCLSALDVPHTAVPDYFLSAYYGNSVLVGSVPSCREEGERTLVSYTFEFALDAPLIKKRWETYSGRYPGVYVHFWESSPRPVDTEAHLSLLDSRFGGGGVPPLITFAPQGPLGEQAAGGTDGSIRLERRGEQVTVEDFHLIDRNSGIMTSSLIATLGPLLLGFGAAGFFSLLLHRLEWGNRGPRPATVNTRRRRYFAGGD